MIYGIQKLSLVDFPHHPSFVIFLGGCNFKCPFCYNSDIVKKNTERYSVENVFAMIQERVGFIEGVVVTGGEPTIYGQDLVKLLRKLKELGLLVKLDSNGTNPRLLTQIFDEQLVDYVAMDLKNTLVKYEMTVGVKVDLDKIKKSIQLIENSGVDYEFRMTVNKEMHTKEDIMVAKKLLKKPEKLILQPYSYSKKQIVKQDFGCYNEQELLQLQSECDILVRS